MGGSWSNGDNQKHHKVVIQGLDHAGKTTIAHFWKFKKSIVDVDTYVPTQGVNHVDLKHKGTSLTLFDLTGEMRSDFAAHYYNNVDAFVYVVDSVDHARMDVMKADFQSALRNPMLQDLPVLVLANKQDHPEAVSAEAVAGLLGLYSLKQTCYIFGTTATTGTNIMKGLGWLVSALKDKTKVKTIDKSTKRMHNKADDPNVPIKDVYNELCDIGNTEYSELGHDNGGSIKDHKGNHARPPTIGGCDLYKLETDSIAYMDSSLYDPFKQSKLTLQDNLSSDTDTSPDHKPGTVNPNDPGNDYLSELKHEVIDIPASMEYDVGKSNKEKTIPSSMEYTIGGRGGTNNMAVNSHLQHQITMTSDQAEMDRLANPGPIKAALCFINNTFTTLKAVFSMVVARTRHKEDDDFS